MIILTDKFLLRSDFSLRTANWASGTTYKVDQLAHNGGITYVCILQHTSAAADEPGVGANEATYWQDFCVGEKGAKGDTGSDGTAADVGLWHLGHAFAAGDRCYHAKTGYGQCVYRCKTGQAHTSAAEDEPEVGVSWEDKWEMFAAGGADGAGTGTMTGPGSSTSGNICVFGDVSGEHVHDGGTPKSVVDTVLLAETASATAPVGTTDKYIVNENGTMKAKTANTMFTRWVSIPIVAAALLPASTSGAGAATQVETTTNKHNFKSMAFGYAAKSYATAEFDLPEGYDGGTIKAYVTWYSTGTTSNGVRWGTQGTSIANDESLDPSWGAAVEVTDNATGAAYKKLKTAVMDSITLGGTPAAGEMASIRVYRDPAHGDDNLNEIVYLLSLKLLLKVNTQSEA